MLHLPFPRRCLLAAMVAVALLAQAAPDPNLRYEMHSMWWDVYTPDKSAVGLFHMDRSQPVDDRGLAKSLDEGLDDLLDGKDADAMDMVSQVAAAENAVIDGGEHKHDGRFFGAVKPTPEGRFGGGLVLAGGSLRSPEYTHVANGAPVTTEAWFKVEEGAAGVLFSIPGKVGGPAAELRRAADGALSIHLNGEKMEHAPIALPAGRWAHVSFILTNARTFDRAKWIMVAEDGEAIVRVDGVPVKAKAAIADEARANMAGIVRLGAASDDGPGLRAVVDEWRISEGARTYYRIDESAVDPDSARELVVGPPFLRDPADLALHLSLDGDLKAPGIAGQALYPEPKPDAQFEKPLQLAFQPGVRGQGLRSSPGSLSPVLTLAEPLPTASGTLEFWFRPDPWDNRRVQGFHDPLDFVPMIRLLGADGSAALSVGALYKKPRTSPPMQLLHPGTWFHVVVTWNGQRRQTYLDGAPIADEAIYALQPKADAMPPAVTQVAIDPTPGHRRPYLDLATRYDEIRLYHRALTAPEVANAYARFLPDGALQPLPFAEAAVHSNGVNRHLDTRLELLSPKRDQVAAIGLQVFAPDADTPVVSADMNPPTDGFATWSTDDIDLGYGDYRLVYTFRDAQDAVIDSMETIHSRPRPPWLDNTLGEHPGEVLPDFEPVAVDGDRIMLWGRAIGIGGNGLPASIVSQDANILAAPIQAIITVDGQEQTGTPKAAPSLSAETPADAQASGSADYGSLVMRGETRVHYDGLMRQTLTIAPTNGPVTVDRLRIEIPYRAEHAVFLSFWTGHRNFRAGTSHGLLPKPDADGRIFDSREPGRPRDQLLKGSFIPYLLMGDDDRTLCWFAESDQGWTVGGPEPAVSVDKRGDQIVLTLNILCEPTEIREPRTIEFGLMATPVKPLRPDHRLFAAGSDFGYVEGFSKQGLKSDSGETLNFGIHPLDLDWDAAARRARIHQDAYAGKHYTKPFLYTDRNWVQLPDDTLEFRGKWFASGFMRYYPDSSADCVIYYMNEWLRRGLLRGIYIDDMWLNLAKDPRFGPAYTLPDGSMQPGFEWWDYHAYLERLRWLFYDNDMEPYIWGHMTDTPYPPMLSFVDLALDGEKAFITWGAKRTFMDVWNHQRFRFWNARKWGWTTRWMNKVGNDQMPPVAMPHWAYRQNRSYAAYLILHDVQDWYGSHRIGDAWVDLAERPADQNPARFIGYWEPESPVVQATDGVLGSVYTDGDTALLVLVNNTQKTTVATVTLDPARFGIDGLSAANLRIEDVDTFEAPPGEDLSRIEKPKVPTAALTTDGAEDELAAMMTDAIADAKVEAEAAAGVFQPTDHNFQQDGAVITLQIRDSNYRLLRISKAK